MESFGACGCRPRRTSRRNCRHFSREKRAAKCNWSLWRYICVGVRSRPGNGFSPAPPPLLHLLPFYKFAQTQLIAQQLDRWCPTFAFFYLLQFSTLSVKKKEKLTVVNVSWSYCEALNCWTLLKVHKKDEEKVLWASLVRTRRNTLSNFPRRWKLAVGVVAWKKDAENSRLERFPLWSKIIFFSAVVGNTKEVKLQDKRTLTQTQSHTQLLPISPHNFSSTSTPSWNATVTTA